MFRVVCPGCRCPMHVGRHVDVGEWVSCPCCEVDLEVVRLNPLVLDWADDGLESAEAACTGLAGARRSKKHQRTSRIKLARNDDDLDYADRPGRKLSGHAPLSV